MASKNLAQLLEAGPHLDCRADERDRRHRFASGVVNGRRDRKSRPAAANIGRDSRLLDRLVLLQELIDQLGFLFAPPAQIGLALRIAALGQERLAARGCQQRAADVRLRVEPSDGIASCLRNIDQVIAGLDAEVRRQSRFRRAARPGLRASPIRRGCDRSRASARTPPARDRSGAAPGGASLWPGGHG